MTNRRLPNITNKLSIKSLMSCFSIILLIGLGFALISGFMRSSDFYKHSVQLATSHPEVVRELGDPVKPRWWLFGSVSSGGLSEQADLRIPLKGSKNSGILFAAGRVDGGVFTYFNLVVQVSGSGEIIDLRR